MTCRDFQIRLEEAIEQRLAPDAATHSHLTHCPEAGCRQLWQEYQLLEESIPPWREDLPSVDLTASVLAELLSEKAESVAVRPLQTVTPRHASGRGKVSAVVAAVSVACLVMLISLRPSPLHQGGPSMAVDRTRPVAPLEGPSTRPLLAEEASVRELGVVYADWMRGATSRVSSTVAFVLPDEEPVSPAGRPNNWIDTVSERLQPLEESLHRTFRLFLDGGEGDSGEQTG